MPTVPCFLSLPYISLSPLNPYPLTSLLQNSHGVSREHRPDECPEQPTSSRGLASHSGRPPAASSSRPPAATSRQTLSTEECPEQRAPSFLARRPGLRRLARDSAASSRVERSAASPQNPPHQAMWGAPPLFGRLPAARHGSGHGAGALRPPGCTRTTEAVGSSRMRHVAGDGGRGDLGED